MSRPGYCTDNAEVVFFSKSLKGERLHSSLCYRSLLKLEGAN